MSIRCWPQLIKICLLISSILIINGCNLGYHDVIPSEFPQHKHQSDGWAQAEEFGKQELKSARVYDSFKTIALFDFIRFSDEIAQANANIKSDRKGARPKIRQEIVFHDLASNADHLEFLLQADVRHSVQDKLDKKNSPWTFWLSTTDEDQIRPSTIEKFKHTDATKKFFGPKYSKFKVLYKLTFPLTSQTLEQAKVRRGPMTITCRSNQHKCSVSWPPAKGWHEPKENDHQDVIELK